jgi:hypothetical protein
VIAQITATFRAGRGLLITFLSVATFVAALASFAMLGAGTAVDDIWTSKEHKYHQMLRFDSDYRCPHRVRARWCRDVKTYKQLKLTARVEQLMLLI